MKTAAAIRREFLDFFRERGHEVVPSSSVVPHEDPTLLFANAGMNQFKDVFLGEGSRPYSRAASTQKCLRVSGKHNDLEAVGRDTYHHTFFEMLGNWSFGDYYKREAIRWAWELLTEVWGLPKDRLYATVFGGNEQVPFDEEAYETWRTETDIDEKRILRFDAKDNFWEMGEIGPCGPCTEIHIDRGERFGRMDPKSCFVNTDSDRFIEIWNLVFIQYDRRKDGSLHSLPAKHVDTGAGFERLCAVMQNCDSNYDTDVFQPLIQRIAADSGVKYTEKDGMPHRVIADHLRSLCFTIADGALPSNEGRGYVLRRLLRRAARFGRELGFRGSFLPGLVDVLCESMGEAFPGLPAQADAIRGVLEAEERSFDRTLDQGLKRFQDLRAELAERKQDTVPGEEAFRLYDTYGFPLDLTEQMAGEHGLQVDSEGYAREMEKQRSQSREARKGSLESGEQQPWQEVRAGSDSFVGYDCLDMATEVLRWRRSSGERMELVLASSPFYAEAGGQVGDRGRIQGGAWSMEVEDTRIVAGVRVHFGRITGDFEPAEPVSASVDPALRRATERNHTATHLLQAALRQVLGEHVRQEGSLVEPGRLRFDFRHTAPLSRAEIEQVERLVMEQARANLRVGVSQSSYDEAIARGAMALFGEKYGDKVRVIDVPGFSTELCGGTHLAATGQLGDFVIVHEGGIAAGVRRIEAVTGEGAQALRQEQQRALDRLADLLSSRGADPLEKLERALEEKKSLEKAHEKLKAELLELKAGAAMDEGEQLAGVTLHVEHVEGASMADLKQLCDKLRESGRDTVALLSAEDKGKVMLAVLVSDAVIARHGLKAGALVKEVAPLVGGGGGGRPQLATAGGKNPAGLPEAREAFRAAVRQVLEQA